MAVADAVDVSLWLGVFEGDPVPVPVEVAVCDGVPVGVPVLEGVDVGVGVGDGSAGTHSTARNADPPGAVASSVYPSPTLGLPS